MTHDPRAPYVPESHKIAAICVPYVQGRALDIGAGMAKVWPSLIAVDNYRTFGGNTAPGINTDVRNLSIFADGSMDACFSSHTLEDIPREEVPAVLAEWWRVLKVGGHLVLYLPHADHYPHIGEPGCNPAHQWEPRNEDVIEIMRGVGSWTLLEDEVRTGGSEYSLYQCYRKLEDTHPSIHRMQVWERNPGGRKRALIIRYGGIGDLIQMSSILPQLRLRGFHITVNCRTETHSVIEHDPNIDEFIIQKTDFVPNDQLGPYWEELGARYDRVINLCESVEGALLQLNERLPSRYPDDVRRKFYGSVNYLQRTHEIADVPFVPAPRFYETVPEFDWALNERRGKQPAILWAINGSAPHKVWPWVHIVATWLLNRTPAHIWLTADGGIGKTLQDAIMEKLREEGASLDRVHPMAGIWTTRQALSFAKLTDCVVGPETGVLNAVSHERVPKVVMLSHSSDTNLTRDWLAATVLTPEAERAPCWPCHTLHSSWAHCHQDEDTHAALCAAGIAPERVFKAVAFAIGARAAA